MGKQQTKKKYNKYNNPACDNTMKFEDCELAILRQAVDENEETKGKKIVNTSEIKSILKIVEDFLIKKKLMCYGGTAINNILPPTNPSSPTTGQIVTKNASWQDFETQTIVNRDTTCLINAGDYVVAIKINNQYRPIWINAVDSLGSCCIN